MKVRIPKREREAVRKEQERMARLPHRRLLLTREDFPHESEKWYANYAYAIESKPYVQLILGKRPATGARSVKRIEIAYMDWDGEETGHVPEPYTLLTREFRTGDPRQLNARSHPDFPYENVMVGNAYRQALPEGYHGRFPAVLGEQSLCLYAPNIWNTYVLYCGSAAINRSSFCIWIYRFTALAFDLVEYPFADDQDWQKRQQVIAQIVRSKLGEGLDCYHRAHWQAFLGSKQLTASDALRNRLLDARKLSESFHEEVAASGPLGQFLHSLADSLYDKLQSDKLLTKCPVCGRFFAFEQRKKYCSLRTEGSDCKKKAENRRYYQRKKPLQREKNRQAVQDLRKFYRDKKISKR